MTEPRIGKQTLALLELLDTRRSNFLRVLSYDRVTEAEPFERQMERLAARHPVVSAAQVLDTFEGGHALPPRAVLLVFRDERSFATLVWPILLRRGFAAVLFVSSARSPAEELRALVRQGIELGVSGDGWSQAEHNARAALTQNLRRDWIDLERDRFGPPRLFAYPDGRPGEEVVEAVRSAGAELAFTALAGTNDLRQVDPMRLRTIQVDGSGSLDGFRARLVLSSPRWSRLGGRAQPVTPEERRSQRAFRVQRARLRFVNRPLDAVLTAGVCPRPSFFSTLRALARRSSNYERLRNLVCLATPLVSARRLQQALLDTTRLPFPVTGVELIGHGSAATVFRLLGERGNVAHALKVYRWTLGQPATLLLRMARRHRARYQELRRWFGESVLGAHFLVLNGPLRALPVAACVQEWIERSTDLLALTDGELLRLLRSRPELRPEFVAFARRVLELRERGFFPDLLGPGNLLLVEHGEVARIRLIDYGLFHLRFHTSGQPVESFARAAALRASACRFESLLRALVPTRPGT